MLIQVSGRVNQILLWLGEYDVEEVGIVQRASSYTLAGSLAAKPVSPSHEASNRRWFQCAGREIEWDDRSMYFANWPGIP